MVLVLLLVDVSQRVKSFEITFTQQIVVRTDLEVDGLATVFDPARPAVTLGADERLVTRLTQ